MGNEIILTEAGRQYAAAYIEHYTNKNLYEALKLYSDVIAAHSGEQEAEYSRMQIHNIVNNVISKQDRLEAEISMARAYFEHEGAVSTETPS